MLDGDGTLQLIVVILKSVQAMGRSGQYLLYARSQEQLSVLQGKLREGVSRPHLVSLITAAILFCTERTKRNPCIFQQLGKS